MARNVKYYNAKRRHAMSVGEDISHVEIFERDGWVCWLCERPINKNLRKPAWWAATLDHVVPLCKWTGDLSLWHTRENVRAAHARCNWDRSDSLPDNIPSTIAV